MSKHLKEMTKMDLIDEMEVEVDHIRAVRISLGMRISLGSSFLSDEDKSAIPDNIIESATNIIEIMKEYKERNSE